MKTLKVEFYRCEWFDGKRIILVDDDTWRNLKDAIELEVCQIEEVELPHPIEFDTAERCQLRALIESVYEVQGLKRQEGESFVPALESLIAKYVALMDRKKEAKHGTDETKGAE